MLTAIGLPPGGSNTVHNKGLGGGRNRSGRFGKEKIILLLRDIGPRVSIPISSFIHPNFLFFVTFFRYLCNKTHRNHHKGLEREISGLKNDPES